jgi:hypothetical protein
MRIVALANYNSLVQRVEEMPIYKFPILNIGPPPDNAIRWTNLAPRTLEPNTAPVTL